MVALEVEEEEVARRRRRGLAWSRLRVGVVKSKSRQHFFDALSVPLPVPG